MNNSTSATILLATDYSPSAQNAATYALHVAKLFNVHLELVHAYIIPFAYTDSPVPLLNVEEIQQIAESSMQSELERLKSRAPSVSISTKLMPGDITDCLAEIIDDRKPLLVIMGTSGSGSDSILWGSMAVKALRNLKAPVLVVPSHANWTPPEKLYFAADYDQISDRTPSAEILNWAQRLDAQLDVVHVDKTGAANQPPELLQQLLASASPQYHTVVEENIEEGITSFLQQMKTGWLLVIPKKYGFFENIFHKSRTKLLTKVSHIPILALHQE